MMRNKVTSELRRLGKPKLTTAIMHEIFQDKQLKIEYTVHLKRSIEINNLGQV